jgi:putative SOS response-associated peptidase YedK
MCGRFVQYSHPEIYASHFDLDSLCAAEPRYNVAPTQPVLAIRQTDGGKRELVRLRWGLVPAWSKGPDNRYSMINARAETVSTKPAYRNAFKLRRCLIPAEGFYEWEAGEGGKTPFLIRREDSAPFTMAGLWERWRGDDGAHLESCTIIVTDANALVRGIHERMPVILPPGDYGAWLDPGNTDTERLLGLLKPTGAEAWSLHPVPRQVNSPRNDGPELLKRVDASD